MKKIGLLLILLTAIVALFFLPYRTWLEQRLESILENKGFENVELSISTLGIKSATLENFTLGKDEKLSLKNVALEYSLQDLWNKNLRDLKLNGLNLNARKTSAGWNVIGFEHWFSNTSTAEPKAFTLPITAEQIAKIPFNRMTLEDSVLNVALPNGTVSLPLEITWQKIPQPHLIYKANNVSLKLGAPEISAGLLTAEASLEGAKWNGKWALENIAINGISTPIPIMKGKGDIIATAETIEIEGAIANDDQKWQGDFKFIQNFNKPDLSNIIITKARMPWKEGRIDVKDVKIPLSSKDPIKVNLLVQSVSIEELMGSLTGGRVSATGKVSGSLPLLVGRNGQITVLPGTLKSEGPGMISMPPEAIPGDNEQVNVVRQILEDLQYTGLSIAIQNDKNGHSSVLMSFEGNNPDVYEGRPVKLNVNLTGDVLEFIQQNILLLGNPEQFLKQGIDEQN